MSDNERWFGRLVDNYDIDATAGGRWITTQRYDAEVPAGKRWIYLGSLVNRNVNSTMSAHIYNATPVAVMRLSNQGAATGLFAFPEAAYQSGAPYILDAGWTVRIDFGTAQDAGSYASCLVIEVDA